MNTISIPAHFDGVQIRLNTPYALKPDARLLVTVFPDRDEEREEWLSLSAQRFVDAYEDDEPEYPLTAIREVNPHDVRR